MKLYLQLFWQNLENGKMQKFGSVCRSFKNLLLQNYSTEFFDIAHKESLVYVIKVCSNSGNMYIIIEIIAGDNLNIANLMQFFENLLF